MFRPRGRKTRLTAIGLGLALTAVLATTNTASADDLSTTVNKNGTWMHLTPDTWTGIVGHANPGDTIEDFCWIASGDSVYDLVVDWTGLGGDHWSGTAAWISEDDLASTGQHTQCSTPPPDGYMSVPGNSWVHSAPFSAAGVTGYFNHGEVVITTYSDGLTWALVHHEDSQNHLQYVGWVAWNELEKTTHPS